MNQRLVQLREMGQSVWLDSISRELLRSGKLQGLIDEGVLGLTSNPTIFQQAVGASSDYDEVIQRAKREGLSVEGAVETLMVEDVQEATRLLRPVYEQTGGVDGYASLEVSPRLAHDTVGTITAARRLWAKLSAPNAMIKVPATAEGIPAIQALLTEGINVNVTLIFSKEVYQQVIEAYLAALESRASDNLPIGNIASVASFFISRLDALVEKRVGTFDEGRKAAAEKLLGKVALANAIVAYDVFRSNFQSSRFERLRELGARAQRPLWASTGVKNPQYSPFLYVAGLAGPDTVTTLPPATLKAVMEAPSLSAGLPGDVFGSKDLLDSLSDHGLDFSELLTSLQKDGVKLFADSYTELLNAVEQKFAA